MALFRVFNGSKQELDQVKKCTEGFAYFTDDDNLYIDVKDSETPELDRRMVGGSATSVAYNVKLEPKDWIETAEGQSLIEPKAHYEIFLNDATYELDGKNLSSIKCGKTGDVPPIISCTDGKTEYSLIKKAVAVPGEGITLIASRKPEINIELVILDDLK